LFVDRNERGASDGSQLGILRLGVEIQKLQERLKSIQESV
jgi:hypothetical protein